MKPTSAISLLYVPSSRSTNYLCLANFWCFKKNSSRVLKTKMTTLFNRSRRKQTQKPPFLVKCILCSSWTKWEQMTWKKNHLTFIEGLESLVYRAWFTLFPHIEWRTIKLQYATNKMVHKSGLKHAWSVVSYHLLGLWPTFFDTSKLALLRLKKCRHAPFEKICPNNNTPLSNLCYVRMCLLKCY